MISHHPPASRLLQRPFQVHHRGPRRAIAHLHRFAGQSLRLAGIMPPPLNLIVYHSPGPRETRYFKGATLEALYPVSGVAPMTALNVTVCSYAGTLFVGLISGRRALPHLHDRKLCQDEVYDEYRQSLVPDKRCCSLNLQPRWQSIDTHMHPGNSFDV